MAPAEFQTQGPGNKKIITTALNGQDWWQSQTEK